MVYFLLMNGASVMVMNMLVENGYIVILQFLFIVQMRVFLIGRRMWQLVISFNLDILLETQFVASLLFLGGLDIPEWLERFAIPGFFDLLGR